MPPETHGFQLELTYQLAECLSLSLWLQCCYTMMGGILEEVHSQCLVDNLVAVEDNLVAWVDNLVAEVDNLVAEVDNLVAEVDNLVAVVDNLVAEVDNLVAVVDNLVAGVEDNPVSHIVEELDPY